MRKTSIILGLFLLIAAPLCAQELNPGGGLVISGGPTVPVFPPGPVSITGNSGNGTDQIGNVNINGQLNVLSCGVKGDGVNDDGASFNTGCRPLLGMTGSDAATLTGIQVLFPSRLPSGARAAYKISTPLNWTGLNGVIFEGQAPNRGIASNSPGPDFLCNTGAGPCVDRSGSNNVTIRNLYLSSVGMTAPSCIGVLDLRTCTSGPGCTGGGFAQHNLIDNAGIWVGDRPSCNSSYGSIGVFNSGAESYTIRGQTEIYADIPVMLAPNNTVGATSSYVTHATYPTSTTHTNIYDSDLNSAGNGAAAVFIDGGVANLDMGSTYTNGSNSAIQIGSGCVGTSCGSLSFFRWHGRFEGNGSNPIAPIYISAPNVASSVSYLNHADIDINFGSNIPEIQVVSAAGVNCPYIANSTIAGEDDAVSGSTSMIAERGSGCGAAAILSYDTIKSTNYTYLTLSDGPPEVGVKLTGSFNPNNINLPANSDYSLNNLGSSATVNTSYNLTAASGTQTISGFGFTPSSCNFLGAVAGSTAGAYVSWGQSDSARATGVMYGLGGHLQVGGTGVVFLADDGTGANNQQATLSSYGLGSITLTWTKTGTPSGTFQESIRCFK